MSAVKVDKTLDIKGLTGSRTKVITANILEKMESGQVLMVITNNMNARQSIPSLCESLGCKLLEFEEDTGTMYFTIQK